MTRQRAGSLFLSVAALTILWSAPAWAKDEACAGISEKCTADVTYDKTINGTIYSCYDCKQALCKDGGNGGLSGTKTSSVCTEKATTFQPIPIDDLFRGNDRLAPKPRPKPLRGSDQRPRSTTQEAKAAPESPLRDHRKGRVPGRGSSPPEQVPEDGDDDGGTGQTLANPGEGGPEEFDEADALFGPRTDVESAQPVVTSTPASVRKKSKQPPRPEPSPTEVISPSGPIPVPYPNTTTVVDHSEPNTESPRRNEPIPARRGTLPAPSEVTISEVGRTSLRINWMDNATMEFGVAVERGMPVEDRGGINHQWKLAFNVEERVMTRVQGTGWRTDEDDQLEPGTNYCYRLRAYRKNHYSSYSRQACARTSP